METEIEGNWELLDGKKWEWDLSFRRECEWDGNKVMEMGGIWYEKYVPAHHSLLCYRHRRRMNDNRAASANHYCAPLLAQQQSRVVGQWSR